MPAEPVSARAASMPRIPSLDGLRAVSIVLVLALHTIQRLSLHRHVSLIWYAIFDGRTGVSIFFVISGYLITSLLLHEHRECGSISMRGFYLRRAMRILPPLYVYIGVLLLLGWAGRLSVNRIDILSALFFLHNYIYAGMWSLEHVWTLSIEEQFYLIWPLVLMLCLRRPGPAGRLAAARIALAVIVAEPVVRVVSYRMHNHWLHNGGGFHMRADSLMFGCVLALLQGTPPFERVYARVTHRWWLPPVVILASDCLGARFQNYWQLPFGLTVCGAAIAFFLLWCVRNPGSMVGRILNTRPVIHLGVLSYSVYIWQTLFLHAGSATIFGSLLRPLAVFPLSWLAILITAELSRHLVELPALRLRNHLIRRFPSCRSQP